MALNVVSSDRLSTNVKTSNLATDLSDKVGQSKNIVINGDFQIAQRATTSTTSGYASVDRFAVDFSGTDEACTQAQVDVTAATTPYTKGFRKALKITNGNQTGGAGTTDYVRIRHVFEAQNLANSGWNFKSSSSYITFSFWIKSSVAQNFYGFFRNSDGTMYQYPFETGSLSADTWTKVTKTIPGNTNLTLNNVNTAGLELYLHAFAGTGETASGVGLNAWATYSGTAKMPDFTSTWYTTNDATMEVTGFQLEVGDTATEFEHRSYGDELSRCQRYYFKQQATGSVSMFGVCFMSTTTQAIGLTHFPVTMRTKPSALEQSGTAGDYQVMHQATGTTCNSVPTVGWNDDWGATTKFWVASGLTQGQAGLLRSADADAFLAWSAEL